MTPAERLSGRMPTEADIDAIARRTLERLPSPFAESLGDIVLLVEDVRRRGYCAARRASHPMQLSGLYEGIPLNRAERRAVRHAARKDHALPPPDPRRMESTGVSLEQLVAHIVIHEVGHHFGFSDDDMHALEDERRVTPLLRFESVALRRGGRLLFEGMISSLARAKRCR